MSAPPYLDTDPHLTFRMDLGRPGLYRVWTLLGEIVSKCKHVAGVPLKPSTRHDLHIAYLAKGAQATTAIEGNTLSEQQVAAAVEQKLTVPESQAYLKQEVENVIKACNWIDSLHDREPLSPSLIKKLHRRVLAGLEVDDHVVPGEYRKVSVGVGGRRGPHWQHSDDLVSKMCGFLEAIDSNAPDGFRKHFAVLRAVLAQLYLVWIHPFGDGNGRTARLLEFWILREAGFPSMSNHLLSNHYNITRSRYYQIIEKSKTEDQPDSFIIYALQGFVDQLREQIDLIREQLIHVSWENFVYEVFRSHRASEATTRRRRVALALRQDGGQVVKPSEIRNLSAALAAAYAGKTAKTITRDLNVLDQAGLIRREGGGIRANVETIFAQMTRHRLGS